MKCMKKTLALLACLLLLFGLMTSCARRGGGSEGLFYELNDDGSTYSVVDIGTCSDRHVVIPQTFRGYPVTGIGDSAFYECESLESVTIPDSVTSLERYAFFGCANLKSVRMSESVESIGGAAFCWCESLTSVTLPTSLTYISNNAFYGCQSLKDIHYRGTEWEWKKIEKGWSWNGKTGSYTINYNYTGYTGE